MLKSETLLAFRVYPFAGRPLSFAREFRLQSFYVRFRNIIQTLHHSPNCGLL